LWLSAVTALDPAAQNPGLFFSLFGPRRTVRTRFIVGFGLDTALAFFLTFSDTITAFAFAFARRVSCWHFFHDIDLLNVTG
jgi:hypothetical protein